MSESDDSQMSHSLEMSDSDHSDQSDSFSDTSSLDNQSFSDQDSDTGLEPHASYQDQLLADSDYAFTTEIKEHDDTADLKELLVAVQNNSLSALKKLLVEFKQLDTQDHSQKAFNLIVFSTVKYTPLVADSVLFRNGARGLPASSPRWPKVQSLVKSYLTSVIKLMQEMTDVSMLRFIVKYMQQSCHYLASFPKLAKQFLKLLIDQWAHSSQDQVKVACFLTIRKLAMTCPEYLDPAIKSSQRALLSNAKDTNVHTWTSLSFMTQCIIELLGLSLPTAYQHMFVSLRQLAIMLRTATAAKVKDSYKAVYNWQCFFNLRLWGKLLCTWADPRIEPADAAILKPLVYPFVQIATGIMKLKPSSRYFPFRLQIIDLLSQVGRATHVFVPLPAYLLENRPKPSTLKAYDLGMCIRSPNEYLGTKTYHKQLVDVIIHHLFDFYAGWSSNIAFPELAVPAIVHLKRILKHGKDFSMNKQIQQLVEQLDKNSKFVESQRNSVSFGPADTEQADEFLRDEVTPLMKYNLSRLAVRQRQVPLEKLDVPDSDNEEEMPQKSTASSAKAAKRNIKQDAHDDDIDVDDQGQDDQLMDFELSEEEER